MSIASRIFAKTFKLPPAETYDIEVERNIQIPMADGAILLADHYSPRRKRKLPTVLIRSPYGRSGIYGLYFGRLFAERGFQVLIQSCRGTFGSEKEFMPFQDEKADGLATLEWLKSQPWFSGEIATVGQSYLGYVQWAIAAEAGSMLKAMAPQITASEFHSLTYPGGSFGLDTVLNWAYILAHQEDPLLTTIQNRAQAAKKMRLAYLHLPLCGADTVAIGKPGAFFCHCIEHGASDDEWWDQVDFSPTVPEITAPVHLMGGWYDIFLPEMIADYTRLKEAGRQPYLTVGPWTHVSPELFVQSLRESIIWFRSAIYGDRSSLRNSPVRVFVMGASQWKDFSEWPPAGSTPQRWYLQPGGKLSTTRPVESEPDRYRYDPADPTPAVGGSALSRNSGPKDNRALEARPDVLTFTTATLDKDLEVIGPVEAELFVDSSLEHTDFFVRLCDVFPSGKSLNVCDGLLRISPGRPARGPDGCFQIKVQLWPTAYLFRSGHRVRVQVSSGAHPRFVRNPGSGEPLGAAINLLPADQAVYHQPGMPSAIILPVQ
ncbi:MAG: CocE/NonD family hydrolase [Omnitrophica WOR_2 bacterium]